MICVVNEHVQLLSINAPYNIDFEFKFNYFVRLCQKSLPKPAKSTGALSARGERARAGLKEAALAVLEREGYHKMRIADVTGEAGVAQGLFYHYFKDLKSLTLEVLTDFSVASNDPCAIEKHVPKGDWYARIYAHNLVIVRTYAKRPGVMRSLLQLADEDEAFSACCARTIATN